MDIISKNEKMTGMIAEKIASSVKGGDVLALRGQLGSGKTTFAKYFARALGVKEEATSPTFVIMKKYEFNKDGQNLNLIHIDAYRLDSADQAESIGLDEIMSDKNNVTLVEWPEKIQSIIPGSAKIIDIEYIDKNQRRFSINQRQYAYLFGNTD